MTDSQASVHLSRRLKHLWIHGFALGLGLVLLGLLVWFFLRGALSYPITRATEEAPPAQVPSQQSVPAVPRVAPPVSPEPTATLRSHLEQVISGIREANQKKDLSRLLSYYSPNFPQLTQRAQSISKTWKIYDYPKMAFDLQEIRLLADDTAMARLTWEVEARNLSTLKSKNYSKTYLIRFVKESGQWRLRALDQVE